MATDIKDVEIVRTGTFNAVTGRVTFTGKDLDDMVTSYEALKEKLRVPVKLGHNKEQKLLQEDGLPAAGWVENLKRVGDRLVGDLMKVPEKIAELINQGAYRTRSLEAVKDGTFSGEKYPMVLTGLALLGADLPAVEGLDDMVDLYEASKSLAGATGGALVVMLARTEENTDKEETGMNLGKLLSSLKKHFGVALAEDMDDDDMDKRMAEGADKLKGKTKAESGEESTETETTTNTETAAEGAENKELAQALARIATLEAEAAMNKAIALVDADIRAGKFLPATRDTLVKIATSSEAEYIQMSKDTPDGTAVPVGQRSAPGAVSMENLAEFEPTDEEKKLMAQTGITREELIIQKAEDAGREIPESVRASLEKKSSKESE